MAQAKGPLLVLRESRGENRELWVGPKFDAWINRPQLKPRLSLNPDTIRWAKARRDAYPPHV